MDSQYATDFPFRLGPPSVLVAHLCPVVRRQCRPSYDCVCLLARRGLVLSVDMHQHRHACWDLTWSSRLRISRGQKWTKEDVWYRTGTPDRVHFGSCHELERVQREHEHLLLVDMVEGHGWDRCGSRLSSQRRHYSRVSTTFLDRSIVLSDIRRSC